MNINDRRIIGNSTNHVMQCHAVYPVIGASLRLDFFCGERFDPRPPLPADFRIAKTSDLLVVDWHGTYSLKGTAQEPVDRNDCAD